MDAWCTSGAVGTGNKLHHQWYQFQSGFAKGNMVLKNQSPVDYNENSVKNVCDAECDGISVTKDHGLCPRIPSSAVSPTLRQLVAVSALSLGCVLDGIVLAYSSPAIPSLEKDTSVELNEHHKSWIGSAHSLGAILGCLISIPSLDKLGRRGASLYIMSLAYIIGFLLIGLSSFPWLIILGRFCGGIGLGLTLSVTPVYLVEVSSLDNRGMLGVVPPLFTQIGVLYTYIVGVYVDWRLLSLTGVSIGLIFILCVWFIPESPLFLASKAKFEAAEASLEWLGRKSDSVKFFKEVQTDMNVFDVTLAKSWKQYIDPRVYKPFLACLSLMFFFQATGYNTIIAYSLNIFHESGSSLDDNIAMGIKGSVIVLSAVFALGLARICLRKHLLVTSCVGVSSSLIILGVYYYIRQFQDIHKWSFVPLLLLVSMIFFFMIGFGALSWTVMAEIMPAKVRGQLYPFTVAFTWLCNFGFNKTFPYIKDFVGLYCAFWIYAALTAIGAIFIIFGLPETKNKSTEEVAEFFNKYSSQRLGAVIVKELNVV